MSDQYFDQYNENTQAFAHGNDIHTNWYGHYHPYMHHHHPYWHRGYWGWTPEHREWHRGYWG
jgi:hypothetical protein